MIFCTTVSCTFYSSVLDDRVVYIYINMLALLSIILSAGLAYFSGTRKVE